MDLHQAKKKALLILKGHSVYPVLHLNQIIVKIFNLSGLSKVDEALNLH